MLVTQVEIGWRGRVAESPGLLVMEGVLTLEGWQLGRLARHPGTPGGVFDPWSGHVPEATSEGVDRCNGKSVFLSF